MLLRIVEAVQMDVFRRVLSEHQERVLLNGVALLVFVVDEIHAEVDLLLSHRPTCLSWVVCTPHPQ